MPGLRMTQVELDRFNRALVAQIEPHLEALRFEDLLIKFTGDGWMLMSPEVSEADRLCALATLMRETFDDEMQRRTDALRSNADALREGGYEEPPSDVYVAPTAFNVIPFACSAKEQGYTDEEWKLVNESRKILSAPDIEIEPTCVRVRGDRPRDRCGHVVPTPDRRRRGADAPRGGPGRPGLDRRGSYTAGLRRDRRRAGRAPVRHGRSPGRNQPVGRGKQPPQGGRR